MKPWLPVIIFLVVLSSGHRALAGTITGQVAAAELRHAGDVVVFVAEPKGGPFAPPEKHATMDQVKLAFVPHVLAILKGTTVDFPNSDDVRHNVFTPSPIGNKFNLGTYKKGVVRSVKFDKAGVVPLLCNIHAEMEGYIVVLENPYFAVTGRDGQFTMSDVPPGKYKLSTWHPKLKAQTREVTLEGDSEVRVSFDLKR